MLTILKQIPIVKALIPLIAGITLVINTELQFPHLKAISIALIVGLLIFNWILPFKKRYKYNWFQGIWLSVIFFLNRLNCGLYQDKTRPLWIMVRSMSSRIINSWINGQ